MTYEPGEGGQAVGAIIDGVKYGTITDVQEHRHSAPPVFSLQQNYPNPFNPTTTITFSLSHPSQVTLAVLDVLGQEVATLVAGTLQPGTYFQTWNAEKRASGIYFYQLRTDDLITTKRMVLTK
jgi:hypothetical protein